MVIAMRLATKFTEYYDKRPLITTMVTNAVSMCISIAEHSLTER